MTRTILIGRGRRLTLEELSAASRDVDAKLELHRPVEGGDNGKEGGFDYDAALGRLSLDDGAGNDGGSSSPSSSLLSPSATLAALTLLGLTVSQGMVVKMCEEGVTLLTSALVDLVNGAKGASSSSSPLRLPSDPGSFAVVVTALLGEESACSPDVFSSDGGAKPFVVRTLHLSRLLLALSKSREFASRSVVDAVGAFSAERLSISVDPNENYGAAQFEERRPHRGCIDSAAALRACLQGSRSWEGRGGKENLDAVSGSAADVRATRDMPQYHGPARESVIAACKTLELECNCSEPRGDAKWDDTVALLAGGAALRAVESLVRGCLARIGENDVAEGDDGERDFDLGQLAAALEKAVAAFQSALEREVKIGCSFVRAELAKKEAELKAKEAEKVQRVTDRSGGEGKPPVSNGGKDEFAGKSDAAKAKILKKRAEKEAKALAKKAAKEAKAAGGEAALSSVFGAGMAAIYPILIQKIGNAPSSVRSLDDPDVLAKLDAAMETLLSGGLQRKPKVPKGTRDYLPEQMNIRDRAFQIIRRVFKRHGAVEIDTPVFELKETLTGKYGEDSKLIYDLADQGGELLALRYDLTVPFARFLAVNAVGNIKRYHIGKVYRRDQPALSRGRYREFYQCDFDIAGNYGRMVPDSECLAVACEILDALPIGNFGIKLNHRRLLDAILDLCGVPSDKFRTICSSVDKLDKESWETVKSEMVDEKGLSPEVADRIGDFVVLSGDPREMYRSLMESKKFGDHKGAAEAMEDLRILFDYLEAMGKLKFISFDLSLARGLDYYTGVIYEAVCMNGNTQVGSIGGGGRYDNLVSMFQEAGKVTPCVGVSIGIERVFTLMEERLREEQGGSIKQPNVAVLVASVGENMMQERMKLANVLWDANISAEFSQQDNPKLKYEISNALDRDIPFMAIVGEEEAKEGKCKLKDLKARTEETVALDGLAEALKNKGAVPVGCEFALEMLKNGGA